MESASNRESAWTIGWDRGKATVQSLGAMLAPIEFDLGNGRHIQPLCIAPWGDDTGPAHGALPGLLQRLRGEWPCVPFGVPPRTGLPPAWQGQAPGLADPSPHGYGANHPWSLVHLAPSEIVLSIDYPADHPIRRLQRHVRGIKGAPRVDIDLHIEARAAIDLGLALHPVFRLPSAPGQAELVVEGMRGGRTFPLQHDASSRARPDAPFEFLSAVPSSNAESLDFSRLPTAEPAEELLQVIAETGRATLVNRVEGYRVTLDYDPGLFPTLLLWVSNQGRREYPWNGRFRALGIEPTRAAFDLGQTVSADPANPWSHAGVPTSVRLTPAAGLSTSYSIHAQAI